MKSTLRLYSVKRIQRRAQRTPMRIALFTGAYNHIADGVSLTLNRLVAYLERQGAEVLVFAPTVDDPPVQHNGTLIPISSFSAPGRPEYRISMGLSRSVRATLKTFKPTLFHIATPDFLGNRALRLAKKWDVPAVASYHTHFSSYLKYYGFEELEGFMWKYLRRFYRQCEHVYVPSHSMAAVLRAHEIRRGLRLWERGVDTALFNPDRRSLPWRRTLGIADEDVVISFVGRLVWEKGLNIYAEVIEKLTARGIPHRSLVVGDGPARAELTERLPETTFTGYLGGEALARAYASSDIFLFPSDTETFGNVTLEAMASGLASVCADATGSNSLVQHSVTGFLAEPGQSRSFLGYVERLALDASLRRGLGLQAAEEAHRYEWDAVLAKLAGYYEEVLNPEPALEPTHAEVDPAPALLVQAS
jgi:phosphatidylinositol alpha 1,6-mannosyltransferase